MLDCEKQLETLRLFNEKVNKLRELTFVKSLMDRGTGVSMTATRRDDGQFDVRWGLTGPSAEAVDAFVLTFRFFIQDNECISLRNLASVYCSGCVDASQRASFNAMRDAVNRMLDSCEFVNLRLNSIIPTNREVMGVFIYGGLAHANPEKHPKYEEWMRHPATAALLQNSFHRILASFLQALVCIERLNAVVIQQMEAQSP